MASTTESTSEPENGWSARSRATRQKLIAAASKLIVEKGINSVSVVAVAKAAEITRPGAYYHFKTRDALLEAVRNDTDHQLVRTVAGSKEDKYLYSQAAEFAAEDQDTIYLRIQRMLEQGADDVIISSRRRGLTRAARESQVKPGVEPDIAAIITSTSLISSFLAVSEFKQKSRRHKQAKLFGKTNYQLLFDGALLPEKLKHWPKMPRYSPAGHDTAKPETAKDTGIQDGRKAKSVETRDLLMKTAMLLMAEVGEQAVSVSEVARRAGVTRPGAYYHFKKKEDLIAAVEEKLDKELIYTLDRSFAKRESFEDASDLSTEDLSLLRIRIQQMLRDGARKDPLIAHYRKLFRWHAKHGHLREGIDPDMTAIITASATLAGLFLVLKGANSVEGRAKQAKRFRKTYMTFVFDGIFTPSAKAEWPPPPEPD
jgi:AcrR family transcriptional regulator